jgi:hypothetical protein
LIGLQPEIKQFAPYGRSSPKDVGLEQQFRAGGVEDGLRWDGYAIDFKIFIHDQKKVDIFRGRFRGDKTAPNESTAEFPVCRGELQKRL